MTAWECQKQMREKQIEPKRWRIFSFQIIYSQFESLSNHCYKFLNKSRPTTSDWERVSPSFLLGRETPIPIPIPSFCIPLLYTNTRPFWATINIWQNAKRTLLKAKKGAGRQPSHRSLSMGLLSEFPFPCEAPQPYSFSSLENTSRETNLATQLAPFDIIVEGQ